MKTILKAFYTKPLVIYLILALIEISTFAGPAEAMFFPAAPHQNMTEATALSASRAADMAGSRRHWNRRFSSKSLWTTGYLLRRLWRG